MGEDKHQAILQNSLNVIMRGVILAIIPIFLALYIGFFVLLYLIINIFIYIYCSYQYGKHWPQLSWVVGILLTLPWFFFTYTMLWRPSYAGGDEGIMFVYFIIFGFINFFVSCIGAYFGALKEKIEKQEQNRKKKQK